MKQATSEIHVISPLFSNYFNRYFRLYLNDIGTCHNLEEDLRRTLLYMFSYMNNSAREIVIENNEKIEDNVLCAFVLCYRLNISPAILRFKNNLPAMVKSREESLALVTQSVSEPYKSSFIKTCGSYLDYEIDFSFEFFNSLLRSFVQHELLHQIIGAPFNAYGEIYTVLISDKLDLAPDSNEWKSYSSVFLKSKYVNVDWKEKRSLYFENTLKGREQLLLNTLSYFEDLALQGKVIPHQYFPNKDLLVYPETLPLSFT